MNKGNSKIPLWQWPTEGTTPEIDVTSITSPYGQNGAIPAMCYPGTPLNPEVAELMSTIGVQQLNAIGTHTHGAMQNGQWTGPDGEGGFGDLAKAERGAIWMIASQLGGRFDTVDGYFCAGGTDSNLMGIWVAREWLKERPAPQNPGIVVLTTAIAHYSIMKAVDITGIGRSMTLDCHTCRRAHIPVGDPSGTGMTFVSMNNQGEMDVRDLKRLIRLKISQGFSRFIVVPTIGTTVLGSTDPIDRISELIEQMHSETLASIYMHVDASFGGFTAPFLAPSQPFGFQNSGVMSITVDADKMGHLPYPAGVFLCRKDLQQLVARRVAYVRGHHDDTLPGSRSALAPLIAYHYYQKIGVNGHKAMVKRCMARRDELLHMLEALKDSRVIPGPIPKWTNFLPLEVSIEQGEIPKELLESKSEPLAPFQLRRDYVPKDPDNVRSCPRIVYKLCLMPHHTSDHLKAFVDALTTVLKH